jgi:hypothetical protein
MYPAAGPMGKWNQGDRVALVGRPLICGTIVGVRGESVQPYESPIPAGLLVLYSVTWDDTGATGVAHEAQLMPCSAAEAEAK